MKKNFVMLSMMMMSLLLSFIYFSCVKPAAPDIEADQPDNTRNGMAPYQKAGDLHNEILSQLQQIGQGYTYEQLYTEAKSIMTQHGHSDFMPYPTFKQLFTDNAGNVYPDLIALLDELPGKYAIFNQNQIDFSNRVNRFRDFIVGMSQQATIDDAIEYVDNYENMVHHTSMPDHERVSILFSIYVERSSLQYWKVHLSGEDLSKNRGWRCWACVAGYDALSGVTIGAIGGVPAGVVSGATLSAIARCCWCKQCSSCGNVNCN
jgi:hypothetical protein